MKASHTPPDLQEIVTAAQGIDSLIALAEGIKANLSSALQDGKASVIAESPPCKDFSSAEQRQDADRAAAEIQFWRDLVRAISNIASDRPEISGTRSKDAWQGTALLQSSLLAEIARLCAEHLRSSKPASRPLGTTIARGPKTEAVAEREGMHIRLNWTRKGTEYFARIYEPMMMDITPALADVLALSVEEPLLANAEYGI